MNAMRCDAMLAMMPFMNLNFKFANVNHSISFRFLSSKEIYYSTKRTLLSQLILHKAYCGTSAVSLCSMLLLFGERRANNEKKASEWNIE